MARTILVIEDERSVARALVRLLASASYEARVAATSREGFEQLSSTPIDLVLLDLQLPDGDGLQVLQRMRAEGYTQPVVIVSGQGGIGAAVESIKLGAFDYIEKPAQPERLLVTIENALRFTRLEHDHRERAERDRRHYRLLGQGAAMKDMVELIDRAAPSDGRVLITGENGTGKELVARRLHERSPRRDHPLVTLNCAAISPELVESELFGHEKGAFTGAVKARRGKFELADGGTLFLDEIGDMPLAVQAKVLRVLESGELVRVGGSATIEVDVRVIAATNRDLEQMVTERSFRRDLFYRLNVVRIHTPPLRDHAGDVPLLVDHFLREVAERHGQPTKRMRAEALAELGRYTFPGNVRELRNIVERLVILADGDEIVAGDLHRALPPREPEVADGEAFQPGMTYRELCAAAQRTILEQAIAAHAGNMSRAAAALGLERSHLYKKCRALGIARE